MSRTRTAFVSLAFLLAACSPPAVGDLPAPEIYSATSTHVQPQPGSSTVISPATLAATPDPYTGLRVADLANREYGGGELLALQELNTNSAFTRYLISYPSDGLAVNGFIDIPAGPGPFPVVLLLHGYVERKGYQVEAYTARYAAEFASASYIVVHPNYRNYAPSDFGPNLFRVGYAIDVLNLIAIVKAQAGAPGSLETASAENIFLWGHSMGGGIAQRVLAVGAPINGALLYSSMSGDERQNFEHIRDVLSEGERGFEELAIPEEALLDISPAYFYSQIAAPVSIHHGDLDDIVPVQWSLDLCGQLSDLGKQVECFTYHNMPHTFYGDNDQLLIQRSLDFFARNTRLP